MRKLLVTLIIVLASTGASQSDEFTDIVESALQLYADGDISGATEELNYATKLLSELKSDSLSTYLPEAMPGWTKENSEVEGTGVAMAMLGGGTATAATYSRDGKDLTITLVANSPMVSSIGAVVSNMSALTGGKSIRIQRTQFANNDGELQGVIDNRVLVSVSGSASLEDKQAYIEQMDLQALRDF